MTIFLSWKLVICPHNAQRESVEQLLIPVLIVLNLYFSNQGLVLSHLTNNTDQAVADLGGLVKPPKLKHDNLAPECRDTIFLEILKL